VNPLKIDLAKANVATYLMLALAAIVVGVGGVVVIAGNLSFADYLADLKNFAIAVGAFAIGKGILNHSSK
jgi:hypothetical protein